MPKKSDNVKKKKVNKPQASKKKTTKAPIKVAKSNKPTPSKPLESKQSSQKTLDTNNQTKTIIILIVSIIVMFVILAIFVLSNALDKSSSDQFEDTSVTETSISTPNANEQVPSQGYLASTSISLQNEGEFEIRRQDEIIDCGSGSVVNKKFIYLHEDGSLLLITPEDAQAYDSNLLTNFDSIMTNQEQTAPDHTRVRSTLFNAACSGFSSQPIVELTSDYEYPGMDEYKIFILGEGQGVFPNLNTVIYAKKGDSYISISAPLRRGQEAADYAYNFFQSECGQSDNPGECVDEELLKQENIAKGNEVAVRLLELFAIEQ